MECIQPCILTIAGMHINRQVFLERGPPSTYINSRSGRALPPQFHTSLLDLGRAMLGLFFA